MKLITLSVNPPSSSRLHHFLPLITMSSPSSVIVLSMLVASLDATPGSVMANADLMSWFMRGVRYFSFCDLVPNMWRTSMLPVSGAWQLKHSEPRRDRPIISAHFPYSTLDIPETAGRKRFHSPRSFALALRASRDSSLFHLFSWSKYPLWRVAVSMGRMCSSRKSRTWRKDRKEGEREREGEEDRG